MHIQRVLRVHSHTYSIVKLTQEKRTVKKEHPNEKERKKKTKIT